MLSFVIGFFTIFPYLIFAITWLLFVRRLNIGRKGKLIWVSVLIFCGSKFLCFRWLGGEAFAPDLPELLIWVWNYAYSAMAILCLLSILLFFRFRGKGLMLPTIALILAAVGLWNGLSAPELREITLRFPDLPLTLDGYRIVQISDLHASFAARAWRTRRVVEIANSAKPDLICLTGDYVDGPEEKLREALEPIKELRARDGVWAVSGNHDHFSRHANWWPLYKQWGIRFLANEWVSPHLGLVLGGVNDEFVYNHGSIPRDAVFPNVQKVFTNAPKDAFRVLLQHRPGYARENIGIHGVRLQLSGHTHGGIMPVFRAIVARYNDGLVYGKYVIPSIRGPAPGILYVNPGSGQWPGFPIRFATPSEVTVIRLVRGTNTDSNLED